MNLDGRNRAPWLPAIPLLALGLRVWRLGAQELRGDESFGFFFSEGSWGEIVRQTIANKEPHPVASYFVQHAWLKVAGDSEFALRFTSAWFSVLAVALLYRLARRLGLSQAIGAAAAGLLAVSPYAIWHSQDARMYSMLLALIVASAWLALEAVTRDRPRYWLAYVAITWLALQTHYSAAFVVFAENMFVVGWALWARQGRALVRWLGSQAALLLIYAPWLWLAGKNLAAYSGNGDSPGWWAMIYRSLSALAFGETIPTGARAGAALLAGSFLALGLAWLLRRGHGRIYAGAWLAVGLAVPLGATWLSGANRPIFNERYLVAAVPPFYLLWATGLVALARPFLARSEKPARVSRRTATWTAAALLALTAVVGLSALYRYYGDPAYSKTHGLRILATEFRLLGAGLPPDRLRVVQNYPDPSIWYYYRGPAEHLVLPPAAGDAAAARREVAALADQGVQRVLLAEFRSEFWDPSDIAFAALAGGFVLADRREVGGWPLSVFVRPDAATLRSTGAAFANGITLDRAVIEPANLTPDGLLVVHLAWTGANTALQGSEKVFVHLADAGGHPVAQSDRPLTAEQLRGITSYAVRLPAELTAGEYHVLTGIYDPGLPGAPRIALIGGGDHVDLGQAKYTGQGTGGQP